MGNTKRTEADKIEALWRDYKAFKDKHARDALIRHYAPLVKYVAGRVAINLPKNVEEGDLIGYGSLGLLDAMERFDPQRGVKFETYAIARIRGSMIDGLRSMDWVPVSVRHRNRRIEETIRELENRLGRSATDAEVADELGITIEEYNKRVQDMASTAILSLEDLWARPEDAETSVRTPEIRDDKARDPLDEAQWTLRKESLAKSIARLPERERLVVTLYYYEGLTVKEIAKIMGVSPSRISQLHTKAVARLRGVFASGNLD
ncbi:MAG TPA: FliA/WhiG family RNA polymerase sigma factor [Firmicutes bacterium]|jgi:RNA polymerase sigma factor for flagellar operon FliA|nr:FliA/WhiG family RNA polymerase sigma factor [Bacillota bacterium]